MILDFKLSRAISSVILSLVFINFRRSRSYLVSRRLSSSMSFNDIRQGQPFVLDAFGARQFNNPSYTGTQINYDADEFVRKINSFFLEEGYELRDGYAPFCKHLFVPNFAGVYCGYTKITPDIIMKIRSEYEARKENELPVLIQYINREEFPSPLATHLDIILYSRQQITEEYNALGEKPPETDAPWGIISVKGQLSDFELPMQPITMMRNALGKAEGGSGVPLDRVKYMESVAFWKDHVAIK